VSHQNRADTRSSLTRCRHGGSTVSQYLRQELHGLLESADKSHIPEMYQYIKELGGYFKRFNGGLLSPWVKPNTPSTATGELDLHARATLTFFEVRAVHSADIFFPNMC
jgi:protein phosphatase PTC6